MKHKSVFCGIGAFILFLSGCAEVPSEVQQEISLLDRIEQQDSAVTEESGIQYQTPAEIRQNVQSLADKPTGIMRVLGTPVIPSADSMPIYQIAPVTLSESEAEACFAQVKAALSDSLTASLPEAKWDRKSELMTEITAFDQNGNAQTVDVSSHNWTAYAEGILALRDDFSASLGVTTHGAVCNFWQYTDPPVYRTNLTAQKTVPVGYDDSALSESYAMMNGEEWSLQDAKTFAENFYNSTFGDWCGKVSFAVKEIRVLKLPEGGFGYDITLQQIYGGNVPLLPLEAPNYQNTSPEHVLFGKTCSIWCVEPNRVQDVSMSGLYRLEQSTENPQLLSAESALNIVSEALAQKKTVSVYMELGFAGVISGSEYMQITGNYNDADFVLQNGDFASCTAVPYWFIWEPVEGLKSRMSGNYYMVNALTGELEIL